MKSHAVPCIVNALLALGLAVAPAYAQVSGQTTLQATGQPTGEAASSGPTDRGGELKPFPMLNALDNPVAWRSYKSRFVTDKGRVVDTGNGRISHSEGQGYGMLIAVAAGDRDAFQRIWDWTRANLMVRDDTLLAWRWEPDKRPGVADMNDATDGDILTAWALAEAGEAWADEGYRVAARRIAVDLARRAVLFKSEPLPLLLPAMTGFSAEDRADGPIVNLSYWVFPAFPRLAAVAPEFDWARLTRAGIDLVMRARFGEAKLPTEWISMRGSVPKAADGFPTVFSYNAIRIPLYLAMAGITDRRYYAPFAQLWGQPDPSGLPIVDIGTNETVGRMQEPGYAAISALTACAASGTALPVGFTEPNSQENYYPATLWLMAMIAANTRYKSCLGR